MTRLWQLLVVPLLVLLIAGCEVEPPEPAPSVPTSYQGPPYEAEGMTVRTTMTSDEPLVWVVTVEVEARAIRLLQPVQFQLKTDRNRYLPYEYSEPKTLQPGDTHTFSATYKVGDYLEKPVSTLIFPQ